MPIKEPPPLRLTAEEPDDNRNNIDQHIIDKIVHEIVNSSLLIVGDVRLTVYQASRILGYDDVHPVLRFIHNGDLKAYKIGRNWLIWKSDLVNFINRQSN